MPVNEIYRDGNVACSYVDKLFTHIYMDRFLCQPSPPLRMQKRKNQFHWKRITVCEELACQSSFTRWKSITVPKAVGPTTVPSKKHSNFQLRQPRVSTEKRVEVSQTRAYETRTPLWGIRLETWLPSAFLAETFKLDFSRQDWKLPG